MSAARDDITVYWGVAAGSTHAAFRRHYEGEPFYQDAPRPTHLMVSWRTENNQIWAGPKWMIDSGGAPQTIIANNGHPDSIHDYLDYLERPPIKYGDDRADVEIEQFALRDWPCEPEVRNQLGLTVEQLQHRTLVDHINMMEQLDRRSIQGEPVAVLQGWAAEDYLEAIDAYKDHGLITDRIAIGTLCTRPNPQVIQTIGRRIASNLPSRCEIHGFGVKTPALREPDALRIFDSIDTLAWDQNIRQATKDGIEMGPVGGGYNSWVEWGDDGNPRYTAPNLWLSYRGYAQQLAAIEPVNTPSDMKVMSIADFSPGMRSDEYIVAECPSGQILDPGRPEPLVGQPQDRFCERSELNILNRRIHLQDQLQLGPPDGEEGLVPGSIEAFEAGHERPPIDQMKERIRELMGE